MTDEEKSRELTRSSFAAQMAMLGYEPNGNPKDIIEVVRCKDCKYRSFYCTEATDGTTLYTCNHPCANDVPRPFDWYCADGRKKDAD